MALSEGRRQQLDGIVQKMLTNKESDENIQFVVNDFKTKYEGKAEGYKAEAASALSEANRLKQTEVGRALGNAFVRTPARFIASAAVAPVDIAKQLGGGEPFSGNIPILNQPTFQAQANQEQKEIFRGQRNPFEALKPFYEVPAAGLETGLGLKGLFGDKALTGANAGQTTTGLFQRTRNALAERKAESVARETQTFVHDLVTPQQTKGTTGTLTKNIKKGNVLEGTTFGGRTVVPNQAQLAIEREVASVPGISKKATLLENNNLILDEISKTAENLRSSLRTQEVMPIVSRQDMNSLVRTARNELSENPLLVGDAEKTGQKILDKFVDLLPRGRDINAEDVLDARQGLDSWLRTLKGNTVFDPARENAVSIALRVIRQGANDLIAAKAPDVAVKEMLRRQTLLYRAVENIAPKAAKEGGTGALRFFGRHPVIRETLRVGGGAVVGGAAAGAGFRLLSE